MEMRNGMIVWAPTDAQMNEIRRRVSKERAKAAADLFKGVRSLFRNARAEAASDKPASAHCAAGA